jgi:hypothetical protein
MPVSGSVRQRAQEWLAQIRIVAERQGRASGQFAGESFFGKRNPAWLNDQGGFGGFSSCATVYNIGHQDRVYDPKRISTWPHLVLSDSATSRQMPATFWRDQVPDALQSDLSVDSSLYLDPMNAMINRATGQTMGNIVMPLAGVEAGASGFAYWMVQSTKNLTEYGARGRGSHPCRWAFLLPEELGHAFWADVSRDPELVNEMFLGSTIGRQMMRPDLGDSGFQRQQVAGTYVIGHPYVEGRTFDGGRGYQPHRVVGESNELRCRFHDASPPSVRPFTL